MTVILLFELLSVFIAAVAAEFEYDADIVSTLPDYQKYQHLVKSGAESIDYDYVINPEAQVHLQRIHQCANQIDFRPCECSSNVNGGTGAGCSIYKLLFRKHKCDEGPGIKAYRVKRIFPIPIRNYMCEITGKHREFYFDKMQITILQNSEGTRYIRLTMEFSDLKNKRRIVIVMNPFTPAKDKANWDHAVTNQLIKIDSFFPATIETRPKQYQYSEFFFFQFNLPHAEKILDRMKCEEETIKFTQRCFAGPVIVQINQFKKILALVDPQWKDAAL